MSVQICASEMDLARAAAGTIVRCARRAIAERGQFTFSLSGGRTPRSTYALLAEEPFRTQIQWAGAHFFWSDERCLPVAHPDNHYGMTQKLLFSRVPLPPENIHRMHGEADPATAADEHEAELKWFFGLAEGEFPCFDLMLQGLGDDGHTASLYPGSSGLLEMKRSVVAHHVPQRSGFRVTLTFPVLNRAREIVFLVTGAEKALALQQVLEEEPSLERPASLVRPVTGNMRWLADEAAAQRLSI